MSCLQYALQLLLRGSVWLWLGLQHGSITGERSCERGAAAEPSRAPLSAMVTTMYCPRKLGGAGGKVKQSL